MAGRLPNVGRPIDRVNLRSDRSSFFVSFLSYGSGQRGWNISCSRMAGRRPVVGTSHRSKQKHSPARGRSFFHHGSQKPLFGWNFAYLAPLPSAMKWDDVQSWRRQNSTGLAQLSRTVLFSSWFGMLHVLFFSARMTSNRWDVQFLQIMVMVD